MTWLPGAFKDLLRHVPTILFEVVPWGALSKDVAILSKRLLTGEGHEQARRSLQDVLPPGMKFRSHASTLPQTPEARRLLGGKILSLYFRQIQQTGPMFLDLRLQGFGVDANEVTWNPTSLWSEFSAGFTAGLSDLYGGFYGQDEERFLRGLASTGLTRDEWSAADKARMAELFRAHFGQALDEPMAFELEKFQASFQAVFNFLMEKKVKLTTDFLLLGVMLVTLYLSLEELGGDYPVAKIYRESCA